MEAITEVILLQSRIASNGTGNPNEFLNYGGGSGGSIQIHTLQLRGNDSLVMANGGFGYGSGGAGSGGRIKINFTYWENTTLWLDQVYDSNLIVKYT